APLGLPSQWTADAGGVCRAQAHVSLLVESHQTERWACGGSHGQLQAGEPARLTIGSAVAQCGFSAWSAQPSPDWLSSPVEVKPRSSTAPPPAVRTRMSARL